MTTQNDPHAVFGNPGVFLDDSIIALNDSIVVPNDPIVVPNDPVAFLNAIIQDMFTLIKTLSAYIDDWYQKEDQDIKAILPVFSTYSLMAVRFGQLLRDRQALSPDKSEGLDEAINQALAELSGEWGVQLV